MSYRRNMLKMLELDESAIEKLQRFVVANKQAMVSYVPVMERRK
jgi:hypothetical protein